MITLSFKTKIVGGAALDATGNANWRFYRTVFGEGETGKEEYLTIQDPTPKSHGMSSVPQ